MLEKRKEQIRKEVEKILKTINDLVGYRDYDKNIMKDLVEESYNLGVKHGKENEL